MAERLSRISSYLTSFLHNALPTLHDDWWNTAVLLHLTHQQENWVRQHNITSLSGLDLAAMRRFSFKISFTYAGAEQIEKLYKSILSPLCTHELTEKQRKVLLACKNLAPGDFAAVRSQFWLDDA